ncbi:MAG: hypothetical protein ACTH31_02675 [Pseudoclavibacter sp.]
MILEWLNSWGAVALTAIATAAAVYSGVVAHQARRDAAFRKSWTVNPHHELVDLRAADNEFCDFTLQNHTRDHATVRRILTAEHSDLLSGQSPLEVGRDESVTIKAMQRRREPLRVVWTRPNSSRREYTYVHRSRQINMRERLRRAWHGFLASNRPF